MPEIPKKPGLSLGNMAQLTEKVVVMDMVLDDRILIVPAFGRN